VLMFRRTAPRTTLAVSTAALAVYIARDYTGGPIFIAPVIAMYEVAAAYPRRKWLEAVGASAAVLTVVGVAAAPDRGAGLHYVLYLSWAVGAGFLGDATRSRREYLVGLEERNRQLVEAQDQEARRQVAEERVRIARDVHDVVAHSLASINIQAAAGVHVADRGHPDQARAALVAIKQASGEALNDLRATLGTLRTDDEHAPRAPAASLRELDVVVDRTVQAGLPVQVRTHGSTDALSPTVDAAAYRIIQEALTNALRHAHASEAIVTVTANGNSLEIEVCDDGEGATSVSDGGHGLAGMRERAEGLGGTLTITTAPRAGFRIAARLPVDGNPA
jgi:signal transduction histidine kinase